MTNQYRLIDVKDEILSVTGKTVKQIRSANKAMQEIFYPSLGKYRKIGDELDLPLIGTSGAIGREGYATWYELYRVNDNQAYLVEAYDGGNTGDAMVINGPIADIATLFEAYFN